MDTEKIRMLLRAIELKSLSKAAQEFNYTSSAFSHMADSVENKLGLNFLSRTHTGIKLYENCEEIEDLFRELIKIEDKIYESARSIRMEYREIKIGTYSSIAKFVLPKLLKSFLDEHSDIKINIIVGNSVSGWLETGKADIVLSDKVFGNQFCNRLLFVDEYVAVSQKDFKKSAPLSKDELYKRPFILPLDAAITTHFDLNKFKDIIKINSSDDALIIQMIKEGIGITVLPHLSVTEHTGDVNISRISSAITRNIYMSFSERNKKGVVKKLAHCIEKEIGTVYSKFPDIYKNTI